VSKTVIVSKIPDSAGDTRLPLEHGGDLNAARDLFPDAPEPFVDLSTGINPFAYALPPLPADLFTCLPDPTAVAGLAAVAATAYGAPSTDHVVVAPGTQSLLAHVFALVPAGNAVVLGPTYAEHARVARLVGHQVKEVDAFGQLKSANLAIVVNPNNPDGSLRQRNALLALADELSGRGGLLIVDEAFMDVGPAGTSLAPSVERGNVVVLRSFGKFFGLAGLRLGFALAPPSLAERLRAALGPWPVSGPAIAIGGRALTDQVWINTMRVRLDATVMRLDALLHDGHLPVIGGTSLFRTVRTAEAEQVFLRLGQAGILVRRFSAQPDLLRLGLPGDEEAWERLRTVLVP
jgi:cobalamin biosynthesis protein CobC